MKIRIEIGEVAVDISDSDVREPNSMRYGDQAERAIKVLHEAKSAALELYKATRDVPLKVEE